MADIQESVTIDIGDTYLAIAPGGLAAWLARVRQFNSLDVQPLQNVERNAAQYMVGELNQQFDTLSNILSADSLARNRVAAERAASTLLKEKRLLVPESATGKLFAHFRGLSGRHGLYALALLRPGFGVGSWLDTPGGRVVDPLAFEIAGALGVMRDTTVLKKEALTAGLTAIEVGLQSTQQASEAAKLATEAATRAADLADKAAKEATSGTNANAKSVDDWINETKADVAGLRDALKTSFATETAHSYWGDQKQRSHRHSAIGWAMLLAIYLVGLAVGIDIVGVRMFASLDQSILNAPFWAIAATIFGALFAIWMGRIITRILMAHVNLLEDARERATMIETFVALVREKAIDPTRADDVIRALFRSAPTGLVGDTAPDTPIEVITKAVMGKGKD